MKQLLVTNDEFITLYNEMSLRELKKVLGVSINLTIAKRDSLGLPKKKKGRSFGTVQLFEDDLSKYSDEVQEILRKLKIRKQNS